AGHGAGHRDNACFRRTIGITLWQACQTSNGRQVDNRTMTLLDHALSDLPGHQERAGKMDIKQSTKCLDLLFHGRKMAIPDPCIVDENIEAPSFSNSDHVVFLRYVALNSEVMVTKFTTTRRRLLTIEIGN